jgi:hypothetical protein
MEAYSNLGCGSRGDNVDEVAPEQHVAEAQQATQKTPPTSVCISTAAAPADCVLNMRGGLARLSQRSRSLQRAPRSGVTAQDRHCPPPLPYGRCARAAQACGALQRRLRTFSSPVHKVRFASSNRIATAAADPSLPFSPEPARRARSGYRMTARSRPTLPSCLGGPQSTPQGRPAMWTLGR